MKKEKEIPETWQYFHELVLAHQLGSDYTLTNLYEHAHCAADLPGIYKRLGWIAIGETPNFWRYIGPKSETITPEMAARIRANWGKSNHKSISKPSQKRPQHKAAHAAASLLEEIEAHKVKSADAWIATDEELVAELRRRGYEVTARKIVEL